MGRSGRKEKLCTEVVANQVSFGESKKNAEEGGYSAPARNDFGSSIPEMPAGPEDDFVALETNDDLPF